jgi:hypothetical protein
LHGGAKMWQGRAVECTVGPTVDRQTGQP